MPKGLNIGFVRKEVSQELKKWTIVEDAVAGEIQVKAKGDSYLPRPNTDTDEARNNRHYEAFKGRAVFYPVTGRTLDGLSGQVFSKEIALGLPVDLETIATDVDGAGTTLEQQAKKTLATVLKKGRGGLLSDFPRVEAGQIVTRADINSGSIRPRVLSYDPSQIINWRESSIGGKTILSLLVLKEEKIINDDGFEFECAPRWRVYQLIEGVAAVTVYRLKSDNTTEGEENEYEVEEETMILMGQGQNNPLTEIPFTFIGAANNDSSVDESPLYPIASLNFAHYRNSADYEWSGHIAGQPTPVFTGLDADWNKNFIQGKVRLGSSNAVGLPSGSTAFLLQAQPNSVPLEAMKHKEDQMKAIGAKLIEPQQTQRTAEEARIEETSEASVLSSIANNVSSAYEKAFYFASKFTSAIELDAISIELNSEFQNAGLNATERQEVVNAWMSGLLTKGEARDVYRQKGIATLPNEDAFNIIAQEGVANFDEPLTQ